MTARHPVRPKLTLALLTLVYVVNFVDRQLVGIVGQPMKAELGLSDTQLGLLGGVAFALFYTVLGLPIARMADRRSRVGIVAISLALWSAMTALCGLAGGFGQLLVARIGVGVGEAGCAPASQSLIADLFPERRATALSILSLGIPAGMLIGAVAGGWLGQTLGWRAAFLALGLPGVLLAAVVGLVLREPERTDPVSDTPRFVDVARMLLRRPAFVHMAAGATLASFAGYGLTSFAVPLIVRHFELPLGIAATGYGLVAGIGIGVGIGGGGWLADRLGRNRKGAPGYVAAGGMIVAALLFQVALSQSSAIAFAAASLIPLLGAHLYFGPTYGVTADSAGPRERATAVAILLMAMNAIGLGLGPLAVGAFSDHFASTGDPSGATGLIHALRLDILVYFWAALHFLLAARAMERDQPQSWAR